MIQLFFLYYLQWHFAISQAEYLLSIFQQGLMWKYFRRTVELDFHWRKLCPSTRFTATEKGNNRLEASWREYGDWGRSLQLNFKMISCYFCSRQLWVVIEVTNISFSLSTVYTVTDLQNLWSILVNTTFIFITRVCGVIRRI